MWPPRGAGDGVRKRSSTASGPGIVLAYHGIAKGQADKFREQMEWLAAHANVQSLSDLARTPQAMSDRSRVAIAFDGAFDSVHRNAIPILDKLGLPATVFAVSDYLGRAPGWDIPAGAGTKHEIGMTVGQLSSLRRDLFEVGSLTSTHPRLDRLPPADSALD